MATQLATASCGASLRLLIAVSLTILGSETARADVIPEEEYACSGKHRAGDVCTGWEKKGICQPSTCLEVDPSTRRGTPRKDRKMIEVPCLKCVWRQAQETPRRSACSIGTLLAAEQELPFTGLLAVGTIGLVALRRRRSLPNKALNAPVDHGRPPAR